MPQYGVLVYLPAPADPMAFTTGYLELLNRYPAQAEQLGGKILGSSYFPGSRGFAFEPSTVAIAIRSDTVHGGPLVESDLVVAGFYVLSAPNLEIAVQIAQLNPATHDGGVEVRPLFVSPGE